MEIVDTTQSNTLIRFLVIRSVLLSSHSVAGKNKVELTREAVVGVTRLAFLCKQSLEKGTVIKLIN